MKIRQFTYRLLREQDLMTPGSPEYRYFETLGRSDRLHRRFTGCDHPPTHAEIANLLRINPLTFMVYWVQQVDPIAEFTVTRTSVTTIRTHWSVHPRLSLFRWRRIASTILDDILYRWRNDQGDPYTETIMTMTPVKNQQSIKFMKLMGFKKLGILPRGTQYLNQICDAQISYLTREEK